MSATLNREAAATGKRQQPLSRKSKPGAPHSHPRARPRRRKMQLNPSLLSNSYSAFFIYRVTARSLERESHAALLATLALSLIKKCNKGKQRGRDTQSELPRSASSRVQQKSGRKQTNKWTDLFIRPARTCIRQPLKDRYCSQVNNLHLSKL